MSQNMHLSYSNDVIGCNIVHFEAPGVEFIYMAFGHGKRLLELTLQ
jgi:hypothetical protein